MDMEEITMLAIGLGVAVLILPLVLVHGSHRAHEISEAWRKLAERHRLHYKPSRRRRREEISGELGGREFLLQRSGANKSNVAYMELLLDDSLPAGLELQPVNQTAQVLATATGLPAITFSEHGHAIDVSEHAKVTAADPEAADAYLTPARARAAVEFAEQGGTIEGRRMKLSVNGIVQELEDLDRALRTMERLAPVFEVRKAPRNGP